MTVESANTAGNAIQLLVFALGGRRYGLRLSAVERVVRAVEITLLPRAPDIVLGVVDVQGRIVPVVNLRRRFGLPEREIVPTDQMIIARTARRPVVLLVDAVSDVQHCPEESLVGAPTVVAGTEYIEGMVALNNELILIQDLDELLSLEEDVSLDQAMDSG